MFGSVSVTWLPHVLTNDQRRRRPSRIAPISLRPSCCSAKGFPAEQGGGVNSQSVTSTSCSCHPASWRSAAHTVGPGAGGGTQNSPLRSFCLWGPKYFCVSVSVGDFLGGESFGGSPLSYLSFIGRRVKRACDANNTVCSEVHEEHRT